MIDVFSILLFVGVGAIILGVVGYVVLLYYKAHSKPCDGVQMGPYDIRGRIGDGKAFRAFAGNLVEVTDYFFFTDLKVGFNESIVPEIKKLTSNIVDQAQRRTQST